MGRAQVEQLDKHGSYLSVPRGVSMWPMIRNGKDIVRVERLDGRAKRYDLVMYERPNGQGVIHRVVRVRQDGYLIVGDNCWRKEYVRFDQVKGIVTRFCRNGVWHELDERAYGIYVHLWVDLLFIRRPILFARDKVRRVARRSYIHED